MKKKDSPDSKAIITPRIDMLCGGGISLVIAALVIAYCGLTRNPVGKIVYFVEIYLIVDLLITGPHFMASYRLLFSRRKNLRKHPIVALLIPGILLGFIAYVTRECFVNPDSIPMKKLFGWLELFAPMLLGWHWVGQSWGTTASFAYLSGFRMNDTERRLIRSGFHALFVFNIALGLETQNFFHSLPLNAGEHLMKSILMLGRVGAVTCFFLGVWGFMRMSQREQKPVPFRVWLPWIATFSWYVMLDVTATSLYLVQGFHALQYLIFPARVEINEYTKTSNRWTHLFIYYILLVVLGAVGFHWADVFGWIDNLGWLDETYAPIALATFISLNLHHYLTDSVIWKIRDPEVRKSIFGHLEPAVV